MTTTGPVIAVELFLSYVGANAPRNGAGARIGLGATRKEAHGRAAHWQNQAPFARARTVTLQDRGPRYRDESEIAERALGYLDLLEEPTTAEKTARGHYLAGRYASAWLALGLDVKATVHDATVTP